MSMSRASTQDNNSKERASTFHNDPLHLLTMVAKASVLRKTLYDAFSRSKSLSQFICSTNNRTPQLLHDVCVHEAEQHLWLATPAHQETFKWQSLVSCLPCEQGHQVVISVCARDTKTAKSDADAGGDIKGASAEAPTSRKETLLFWTDSMVVIDLDERLQVMTQKLGNEEDHVTADEWANHAATDLARIIDALSVRMHIHPWIVHEFPRVSPRELELVHQAVHATNKTAVPSASAMIKAESKSPKPKQPLQHQMTTRTNKKEPTSSASSSTTKGQTREQAFEQTQTEIKLWQIPILPSGKNARVILNDLKTKFGLMVTFDECKSYQSSSTKQNQWLASLTVTLNRQTQISVSGVHGSQGKSAEVAALGFLGHCLLDYHKYGDKSVWSDMARVLEQGFGVKSTLASAKSTNA
jgi:hypothetical protein